MGGAFEAIEERVFLRPSLYPLTLFPSFSLSLSLPLSFSQKTATPRSEPCVVASSLCASLRSPVRPLRPEGRLDARRDASSPRGYIDRDADAVPLRRATSFPPLLPCFSLVTASCRASRPALFLFCLSSRPHPDLGPAFLSFFLYISTLLPLPLFALDETTTDNRQRRRAHSTSRTVFLAPPPLQPRDLEEGARATVVRR